MIKGESATRLERKVANNRDRDGGRSGCCRADRGVRRGRRKRRRGSYRCRYDLFRETTTAAIVATTFLAKLHLRRDGVGKVWRESVAWCELCEVRYLDEEWR